jgi:L-rhamnose mutarotase
MLRRAFSMRLKPDSLAEYKRRHDNIWPELVAEIERCGIVSITTFQRELDLLVVSEVADEGAWERLWSSEVHKRWSQWMQPLMQVVEGGTVEAGELVQMFHLAVAAPRATAAEPVAVAGGADSPLEASTAAPSLEAQIATGPWPASWPQPVAVAAVEVPLEALAAGASELFAGSNDGHHGLGSNGAPIDSPSALEQWSIEVPAQDASPMAPDTVRPDKPAGKRASRRSRRPVTSKTRRVKTASVSKAKATPVKRRKRRVTNAVKKQKMAVKKKPAAKPKAKKAKKPRRK